MHVYVIAYLIYIISESVHTKTPSAHLTADAIKNPVKNSSISFKQSTKQITPAFLDSKMYFIYVQGVFYLAL